MCGLPSGVLAQGAAHEGLGLAQAIRIVLVESPASQIAEAQIAVAEDGRKAARGRFLPRLRAEVDYTNLNKVPEIPIPEEIESSPFPIQFSAGDTEQLNVRATLEQPLFTGLALLTRYRVAGLGTRRADVRQETTRQELILRAYEAYYGVLLAEKFVEVAEQAVSQLTSQAEVAKQFYETGETPKNEYLKVLVDLADTKRRRIVANYDLGFAQSRLRTLLRWDGNRPLRLTEELEYRPYERSLDDCLGISYRYHPRILLADIEIETTNHGITGARSRYYPQVSLVGGFSHEEGGFTEGDDILSATLHAEWLVWEWGSNYYEVRQEKSRLLQARARKNQARDLTELEVREAFIAFQGSREAIEVARVGLEQADENYRITDEQFQESIATSQDVLNAQTGQSQAQVNYYEALNSYIVAIARLERAMGILQEPGEADSVPDVLKEQENYFSEDG
jgi:outer membrane protein TolC